MWSLEIRTQRIFNNLIKQNQKLASDFVLKQSKIMPSSQSPASNVQCRESRVQSPASRIQRPESSVQSPTSRVQRPDSSVQTLASRLQRLTFAPRVQEFRYALLYDLNLNVRFENVILKLKVLQWYWLLTYIGLSISHISNFENWNSFMACEYQSGNSLIDRETRCTWINKD